MLGRFSAEHEESPFPGSCAQFSPLIKAIQGDPCKLGKEDEFSRWTDNTIDNRGVTLEKEVLQ